jgi:conjugative transposon TraN protein
MKLFFYPTLLVGLSLSLSGYAQKEGVSVANPILSQSVNSTPYILPIDKGSVKGSYPLGVSNRKTTHIIFPAKIREFDAGTGDVIAQIPETVPNILRVKAKEKADFCETNMTVITEEGGFYSFLVRFQEDPEILNINIANNLLADNFTSEQKGMNRSPIISFVDKPNEKNENEMLTECQKVQKLTSYIRNIGASKMKLTCLLTSLYVKNKTIYFQMTVRNDSEIDYEIDFFKFYLRDKDVLKRMAAQEVELKPFANYPKTLTTIRSNTEYTTVYALPLRTFPEDKVIEVELYEKDGGRHLRFQVESDIMLQAKNL